MRRTGLIVLIGILLAATALVTISSTTDGPVRWTPDGLFYQARALELRGQDQATALERTFQGPLGSNLRLTDPEHSGDPSWVTYNAPFYERRVAVPAAAAALEPIAGDRAILDLSIAGYVAAILAIFALLLLRFSLPIATAVTLATSFLPALTRHSAFPLTDSWGLALETAAFTFAILAIRRGTRWVVPWAAAILVLSFTRDSMWIPILAAGWLAVTLRSRVSWWLAGTGVAAVLPVLLLFSLPTRELLATMLNGAQPVADPSWSFVAQHYPGAIVDLLRADGGAVRNGEFLTALFFLGGLLLLFALARRSHEGPVATLLKAGSMAGVAYVLAVPIFSAFRLELVLVPMAAFGLGLGAERLLAYATAMSRAHTPTLVPRRSQT